MAVDGIFGFHNSGERTSYQNLVGGSQGATMCRTNLPTLLPYNKECLAQMSIITMLRNLTLSYHPLIRNVSLFPTAGGKDDRFHVPLSPV